MAILNFRVFQTRAAALRSMAWSCWLRLAAIAAIHLAALVRIVSTEYGAFANGLALLAWGFLNFFWLIVLRRPAMAAALSLVFIEGLIALSRFKFAILEMTL